MIQPPKPIDLEVAAVEQAIRKLTEEQWAEVYERLDLCAGCGTIDSGRRWCCIRTPS
jgi:hypothetical protein